MKKTKNKKITPSQLSKKLLSLIPQNTLPLTPQEQSHLLLTWLIERSEQKNKGGKK